MWKPFSVKMSKSSEMSPPQYLVDCIPASVRNARVLGVLEEERPDSLPEGSRSHVRMCSQSDDLVVAALNELCSVSLKAASRSLRFVHDDANGFTPFCARYSSTRCSSSWERLSMNSMDRMTRGSNGAKFQFFSSIVTRFDRE